MIKVLIVDDMMILRECLRMVINQFSEFEVLECAADGSEAIRLSELNPPDVILMDLNMPVLSGHDAIIKIKARNPHIKILVLTAEEDEKEITRAFQNGADGYALKNIAPANLAAMIHRTHRGEQFVHEGAFSVGIVATQKSDISTTNNQQWPAAFTEREKEVLLLVTEGMTNEEIADRIGVSIGRARNIVTELISKAMVKNRTQLAVMAVKRRLLRPN